MAEPVLLPAGVCSNFEPQRWRRKKCKVCFHDVFRHSGREVSTVTRGASEFHTDSGVHLPNEEVEYEASDDAERLCYEHEIVVEGSLDFNSTETPTVAANLVDDTVKLVLKTQDAQDEDYSEYGIINGEQDKDDLRDKSYSFDSDDKMRKDSTCQLTRLPTVDRSSNSSLASFDGQEEGSMSYPSYGGSRETLDSFSINSAGDFTDDITSLREKESKIIYLEQEIEKITDTHRAAEASKDRHVQSLEREIQNLRLEIANFTARENVSVLKSRLELESKSLKIYDLENELRHLHDTIEKMTVNKHSEEFDQDKLQRELTRSKNKIVTLEEEKKTLEERLTLAEDLQNNDRELLEVLRHQLIALEKDLAFCQERTKDFDEKVKMLEKCEHDLVEEKVKNSKLLKQLDGLTGKLRQRDKQVNDLEDDNVRLQQLNMDYRKEINRDLEIIEKLEGKLLLRQREVDECNREVVILSAEKRRLSQKQFTLPPRPNVQDDTQVKQIEELEAKLAESDSQVQDLQLENDQLIREIGDLLENLSLVNNDLEDCKGQVQKAEKDLESFRRIRRDNERKIHSLQKKLNRVDREKKKLMQEKLETDEKVNYLHAELEKAIAQRDESDKNQKMLMLKLKSTEAKLAMIEGNKMYVESKLNNYESKMKEQANMIRKFGYLTEADSDDELRDLKEKNVIYKNQIEITEQISKESEKIINELQIQNKDYSISVVAMQREIMDLKEAISRTQDLNDSLRHLLSSNVKVIIFARQWLEKCLGRLKEDVSFDTKVQELEHLCHRMKEFCGQLSTIEKDSKDNNFNMERVQVHSEDTQHQVVWSNLYSKQLILEDNKMDANIVNLVKNFTDQSEQSHRNTSNSDRDFDHVSAQYNTQTTQVDDNKTYGQISTDISGSSSRRFGDGELSSASNQLVTVETKIIAKPETSRQRSISVPDLSEAKQEQSWNVEMDTTKESTPIKKVVTSAFHVAPETSRRVFASDLTANRTLSKTMSEACLVTSDTQEDNEGENHVGHFVIQSGGDGIQVQDGQQGSLVIRISPSMID